MTSTEWLLCMENSKYSGESALAVLGFSNMIPYSAEMWDFPIKMTSYIFKSVILHIVELQWLEHRWLVYHGYFKLILESLGNNPIAADLG